MHGRLEGQKKERVRRMNMMKNCYARKKLLCTPKNSYAREGKSLCGSENEEYLKEQTNRFRTLYPEK